MSVPSVSPQILQALRRSVLFADLAPRELEDVATRLGAMDVRAGTVLCREGQPGHDMFVIDAGRFAVAGRVGDRTVVFAELGPGDVFGEMAVLTGRPRSATVTAQSDGRLLVLDRDNFHDLARRYPSLGQAVQRLVAERSNGTMQDQLRNERSEVLSLGDVQNRAIIGRADDCDIVLDRPAISRHHAEIRCEGDVCQITDLNSYNGTFLNGRRITTSVLRDGDTIYIGGVQIYFDRSSVSRFSRGGGVKVEALNVSKVVGKGITILNDVSLAINPGEFVCIVGGSGAGKTTLLDTLNGFRPASSGQVVYNDVDCYEHFDLFRQGLGYVPQDDIVHPELTVFQTLYYAARLRLPGDTSGEEIEALINEVMETLELTQRRDTQILRLSGGQRKRVSIGVELLTRPDIFFLDEPTSGLDPGLDGRMMELMRKLADEGRTVILTTHATRNIMMCDKVVFMARGGHLAYFGPPAEALTYFKVDEFAEIYKLLDPPEAPLAWKQWFLQSDVYLRNIHQPLEAAQQRQYAHSGANENMVTKRKGASWLGQMIWLTARFFRILIRDPIALGVLLAAAPMIAWVMTQTFDKDTFALTRDEGGKAIEGIALHFFMATASLFLGGFVASRAIAEEQAVYKRERLVNLGLVPYVLSKVCVLGVFSVIQSASLLGVVAWGVDFPGGNDVVLKSFAILVLTNLVAVGMGLFVSSLAGNGLQATLILVVLLIPQLLLGGAVVPLSRVKDAAKSMSYAMINRWSVSLLGYVTDINDRLERQFPVNDYFDQFNINPTRYTLILVGFLVVFLVGSMVALKMKDVR
jgi:ABC-type multidrug transport system ATPase subunit/CRP-like cAMP-binding protein/ABC-type multidrug transport system permease subunit